MLRSLLGGPQSSGGDTSSSVLESKDVLGLAKYMKSKECRKVFVMLGAGVSTAAGIPDFRSPETGLYANLARLNLPYPEAVFSIQFFRQNPHPFYALAKELYPGKYRPTLSHSFVKLLSDKRLLKTCFTQNIDTLERRAGVPDNEVVEAHGSFASHKCIDCKASFSDEDMKRHVDASSIPKCEQCDGLVKPDIVFFGESLPESFFSSISKLHEADLLIVMGTSLVVHPFASLVDRVPDDCVRVLINMEPAGDIGELDNDIVLLGKCDEIVQQLATELGWDDELKEAWAATAESVETQVQPESASATTSGGAAVEDDLEDEVDKLADAVGASLTTDDTTEERAAEPTTSADSHHEKDLLKEKSSSHLVESLDTAQPSDDAHATSADDATKFQVSDTKV
ncbi:NAD-dependent deacetylase sirtuin-2 [Peniophora sp. CONT]|nr:NAD-dependent deacetylase sirtuin-2 [Peniophora sp. CONT]